MEGVQDINKLFEREQYWIDKVKSYDSKYGYNIMKQAGTAPHKVIASEKYKKAKKKKEQIKHIELLKIEYESSKIKSELLKTNIKVTEKEMSTSIYNKLKKFYTILPIYEKVLIKRIIPFLKDKLKDKLILNAELTNYANNHSIKFYIQGVLQEDNKNITQCTSYGELKNAMDKLNISLEDAIFKIITEETKCGVPYIIKEK